MSRLDEVAPAFIALAHPIVWATCGTTDRHSRPRTRVLHPLWEWDGTSLTGWILTSPISPKAADLDASPYLSVTYWAPSQDTCTADCSVSWESSPEQRQSGWDRFANGPEPVGYDPSIITQWPSPDAPEFGVLRLEPDRLRVMPGEVMTAGKAELLMTWRRG